MNKHTDIPAFAEVKETRTCGSTIALIVPALFAGVRGRYHVIRVHRGEGTVRCIGREVDLKLARDLAERHYQLDGEPLR